MSEEHRSLSNKRWQRGSKTLTVFAKDSFGEILPADNELISEDIVDKNLLAMVDEFCLLSKCKTTEDIRQWGSYSWWQSCATYIGRNSVRNWMTTNPGTLIPFVGVKTKLPLLVWLSDPDTNLLKAVCFVATPLRSLGSKDRPGDILHLIDLN